MPNLEDWPVRRVSANSTIAGELMPKQTKPRRIVKYRAWCAACDTVQTFTATRQDGRVVTPWKDEKGHELQ